MTTTADLSETLRQRMTDDLVTRGYLRTQRWQDAFRAVPRETFVRRYAVPSPHGERQHYDLDDPAQHAPALTAVYNDTSLITQQDANGTATSSSTAPSLMALMLEALDAEPGMTVLEVGTGTGYNAALLSHVLGAEAVTTMDVHPSLTALARQALHRAGHHPTVICGDGALGHTDHAPYDRLIATCGINRIPATWLYQVRPGGIILANVGFGLARLTIGPGPTASGPFLDYAAFMPLRTSLTEPSATARDVLALASGDGTRRTLPLPTALDERPVVFLRSVMMPGVIEVTEHHRDGPERVLAHPESGSWARARSERPGTITVIEHGPRHLWDELATAAATWTDTGQADISAYGLTVTRDGQHALWLSTPDHSWSLTR